MRPSAKNHTSWAIRSSRTRRRWSRLPFPPARICAADLQRVEAWIADARSPEAEEVARQRHAVLHHLARFGAHAAAAGSCRGAAGWPGWHGISPKYLSTHTRAWAGIHIADDREDRVVGRVVGAEEAGHVLERGRVEILHRPDRGVVVGVVRREQMAPAACGTSRRRAGCRSSSASRSSPRRAGCPGSPGSARRAAWPSGPPRATARAPAGGWAPSRSSWSDPATSCRSSCRRRPGPGPCAPPWPRGRSPGTSRARRDARSRSCPGTSCLEPTLYQMFTATTGARWSSETIRRRPLARRSSREPRRRDGHRVLLLHRGAADWRQVTRWRALYRPARAVTVGRRARVTGS